MVSFSSLSDDILYTVFSFLSPVELLRIRQTCGRLGSLSRERSVWVEACQHHVLSKGYPFPRGIKLDSMSLEELERYTMQGAKLPTTWRERANTKWPTPSGDPLGGFQSTMSIEGHSGSAVTHTYWLPRSNMLLTVSKSIWLVITIWSVGRLGDPSPQPTKLCEWSPRGSIFKGLAINADPASPATLAVSVLDQSSEHQVHILSLKGSADSLFLETLVSFPTFFVPMTLEGNRVALCDDLAQTAIWDWSTSEYAVLDESLRQERTEPESLRDLWGHDLPAQVLFAHESIIVVRARSLCLFPDPKTIAGQATPSSTLKDATDTRAAPPDIAPLARHSFGWLDGVSIAPRVSINSQAGQPLSYTILLRAESDDPWLPVNSHHLQVYSLVFNREYLKYREDHPSPSDSMNDSPSDAADGTPSPTSGPTPPLPYIFPPTFETSIPTSRGPLRCQTIRVGRCGTAVWVKPSQSWGETMGMVSPSLVTSMGPLAEHIVIAGQSGGYEDWSRKVCLMASILPGSPLRAEAAIGSETTPSLLMCANLELHDWTSLDYDEDTGRIAIGKGNGDVLVLTI
ncbi:hypothetical protein BKA70DRAFT_1315627 [Coprinopsis sp. MPI-PUGE-AT-0042]|nr:hypothetical protein BKA70DRAFT_1315627 [Coprinopsis sp. MPI-PUGE-AT-0042]